MLFTGCILCLTAGGCLPSRRVPRASGSWGRFYGCHQALAGPRVRQASFVLERILSIHWLTRHYTHRGADSEKSMLRCGQTPRPK